jgi:hypothetical protein
LGKPDMDVPLMGWMSKRRGRRPITTDDAEVLQLAMNVLAEL